MRSSHTQCVAYNVYVRLLTFNFSFNVSVAMAGP